ncbi:hypothetical protein EON81_03275 [bacterium]|nr:MAG: hypothetical protein EON81_03275 [bacterium]
MMNLLRNASKVASLAALVLTGLSSAQAGSYVLRTKDAFGATIKNPSGGTYTQPGVSAAYYSTVVAGSVAGYGGIGGHGAGGATCSGTITTIYDWKRSQIVNPDPLSQTNSDPSDDYIDDPLDNPPLEAIARETCRADYSTNSYPGGGGGSCDNGLGFAPVEISAPITVPGPPPVTIGFHTEGYSEGTRYKKVSGGDTITLTCTPSSSASTVSGSAACKVAYNSSILVPKVVVVGVTRFPDAYRFITGQQISDSIDSAGLTVKSGTYQWSISGGMPFKSWSIGSGYSGNGVVNMHTAGDLKNTSVNYYTRENGVSDVQCQLSLLVPPGATIDGGGTSIPMTLVAKPATSMRPELTSWTITDGAVGMNGAGTGFGFFGLTGGTNGQQWTNVTIDLAAPFGKVGIGCFVQLITADRSLTRTTVAPYSSTYTYLTNAFLDAGLPYPYASPTWTITGTGIGYDSPQQFFTTPLVSGDLGGTNWYSAGANDSFSTWVMYRPPTVPGQATTYIPLASYTWMWGGSATKSGGVWTVSGDPASGKTSSHTRTTTHPSWNGFSPSPFNLAP